MRSLNVMDCKNSSSHTNYMLAKRSLQVTHKRYHSYDSGVLSDADMSRNTLSSADSEQSCSSAHYSFSDSPSSSNRGYSTCSSSQSTPHIPSAAHCPCHCTSIDETRLTGPALPEVDRPPWSESEVLLTLQSGKFKDRCDNLSVECLRRFCYLLQRPLIRITREAKRFSSLYNKCSKHNVQSACKVVLSPRLYSKCDKAASRAVTIYSLATRTLSGSKSSVCGLSLSVGKHHRWLLDSAVSAYVPELSAVYLCGVMETIIEQTLILAVSDKCLGDDTVITTDLLETGFQQSAGLRSLYHPYTQLLPNRDYNDVSMHLDTCCMSSNSDSSFHQLVCHNLLSTCASSLKELRELVSQAVLYGDEGVASSSKSIFWSSCAIDTLYYYMKCGGQLCSCNKYSEAPSQTRWNLSPPPLHEWVRACVAFAEQRKTTQVEGDDVRQAARVLLPNCDCPVRPARQARLTASVTSPAAASGDVIEMLQRELAVTLLLEEKLNVAPQAISILQQHGLDEADEQGLTALMYACLNGSETCALRLLQAGADPNTKVPQYNPTCAGWTALHLTTVTENTSITRLLLEHGADVEGDWECAESLVETPIQIASALGCLQIVSLLLRKRANPFRCTFTRKTLQPCISFTAASLAASHGHLSALRRLFASAELRASCCETGDKLTLSEMFSNARNERERHASREACNKLKQETQKPHTENDYMVIENEYMTIEEVFQPESDLSKLHDQLSPPCVDSLVDALYSSSENGFLDISMEVHSMGVPWSLYTWHTTLSTAYRNNRKALIQSLLYDFHTVYKCETSPLLAQQSLPLMFEIFRESKNEMISRQLSAIFSHLYGAQPLPVLKDSQIHPRPLIDCQTYMNTRDHSDISFTVDGKLFYAHKIILAGASHTFRSMLSAFTSVSMPQIDIADMDCQTFEYVLKYLYGGVNEVTSSLTGDHRATRSLLAAAHYFKLDGLKRRCEILLSKNLSADHCVSVYKTSKTYDCSDLMEMCEEYFLRNLTSLLKTNETFTRVLYSNKLHNRELLNRLLTTLVNRLSARCH